MRFWTLFQGKDASWFFYSCYNTRALAEAAILRYLTATPRRRWRVFYVG